LEVVAKAI